MKYGQAPSFGDSICITKFASTVTINYHYSSNKFGSIAPGLQMFFVSVQKSDLDGVNNFKYSDIYDEEVIKNYIATAVISTIFVFILCTIIYRNKRKNNANTKIIKIIIAIIGIILLLVFIIYVTNLYNEATEPMMLDKPIIYIYPEEETNVKVTLKNSDKLTHTYPIYKNSWNVLAKTNGDLVDLETGRTLYALYWEGINTVKPNMNMGFIVKGTDTIKFLEEKLKILGLSEREANEFIIYWLPQLEGNKYNYIRFQTIEEINENMPLEILPTPDNVIRIMMEYKPLDEYVEVKNQKLETPNRNGFIVVEWGGTEIK